MTKMQIAGVVLARDGMTILFTVLIFVFIEPSGFGVWLLGFAQALGLSIPWERLK